MSYRREYALGEPERVNVDAFPGTTLLEFGAPWCGHCLAAQPALHEVLHDRNDVHHCKIEDGPGRPLGRSFRIKLWPTLVLLENGKEIGRVVRPRSTQEIRELLAGLEQPG
ncbi:MAG: thioredoxin family protein [Pseudoxanthomonas sp.]